MGASKKPEITLELTGGSLTIKAAEAIYHIVVRGGLASALPAGEQQAALPPGVEAQAPALAPPQEQGHSAEPAGDDDWDDLDLSLPDEPPAEAPAAAPEGAPDDDEYYRDLSHDMFREVGRLARRLSMSIRDVEVDKVEALDFEAAGDQLETAKDQLESVVKMTEKATLKIMDLGESIQSSISKAREIMKNMASAGQGEAPAEEEPDEEARAAAGELTAALEALTGFLAGLDGQVYEDLAQEAEAIKAELASAETAPAPEPAPKPEPAGPAYDFPLDLVFQTAYELCTNEAVKKHIKVMWDSGEKGFAPADVSKALNAIVTMEPDEDNFLNLNLKDVLKALFAATSNDKFKQILKKMASTADQIFLDQFLPMEAVPVSGEQAAAPAEPAPAPAPAPAGPSPAVLEKLDALAARIKETAQTISPPPEASADLSALLQKALSSVASTGASLGVDAQSLADLEESMSTVFTDVNSIIEALSFQDLSGQAIYKIVMLLTDFQVQLLAMVVSFGSKIKIKESDQKATPDQSEKMAQEEVDRVMGSLKAQPGEGEEDEGPGKLDQGSVNNLLDSLGF